MLEGFAMSSTPNSGLTHSVLRSQCDSGDATCHSDPNRTHVVLGQTSVLMAISPSERLGSMRHVWSRAFDSILNVFDIGSCVQVTRVAAWLVVAVVQSPQITDRTNRQLKRNPVCAAPSSVNGNLAISARDATAHEWPTGVVSTGSINACPESINKLGGILGVHGRVPPVMPSRGRSTAARAFCAPILPHIRSQAVAL